ncbi:MAG: nicotinate-nucleotide adenylyltransferase [Candidatus Omnitrophica bacterium]|nr:nicotinate-nucleotide adenylyltransferase [Candidatus Omnitrophota bacterium]
MKRIGFFGGTFNPIHMGHLAIAQMAQERFKLDKVIFIPSHQPPHKNIAPLASAKDRYKMVRLATAGNEYFEVSDVETKRVGKSYTVDTLRHFRKSYPAKVKFFFIIGGDSLGTLPQWKNIDEILKLAAFIVVNRPGYSDIKNIKHLTVTKPGIDISSSYLRERINSRKSIRYLVPEAIYHYIIKHGLYKTQKKG